MPVAGDINKVLSITLVAKDAMSGVTKALSGTVTAFRSTVVKELSAAAEGWKRFGKEILTAINPVNILGKALHLLLTPVRLIGDAFASVFHAVLHPVELVERALHFLLDPLSLIRNTILFEIGHRILDYALEAAEAAHQIETLGLKLGMTTKSVQEFSFVATQSGTTLEALSQQWIKLGQAVSMAAENSTGRAAKALRELGLSAEVLLALSPEQQFEAVSRAMAGIADQSDRVRIAIDLMGRTGAESLKVFALTSAQLQEMKQDAANLNAVLAPGTITVLANVAKAWDRVKVSLDGFRNLMMEVAGPILARFLNQAANKIAEFARFTQKIFAAVVAAFDDGLIADKARQTIGILGTDIEAMAFAAAKSAGRAAGVALVVAADYFGPVIGTHLWERASLAILQGITDFQNSLPTWLRVLMGITTEGASELSTLLLNRINDLAQANAKLTNGDTAKGFAQAWLDAAPIVNEALTETVSDSAAAGKNIVGDIQILAQIGGYAMEKIRDNAEQAAHGVDALAQSTRDLTTFWAGFADAATKTWIELNNQFKQGQDFFNNLYGAFTTGIDDMVNSAVNGTLKISDAFKNMGREVLKVLINIAAQEAAVGIVNMIFGGASAFGTSAGTGSFWGSVATGGPAPPSQAAGGGSFMTTRPTLLLVGDNPGHRERVDVTPLSGKGRTRVGRGLIRLGGGGTVDAYGPPAGIPMMRGGDHYDVVIKANDAKSFSDMLASSDGQRTLVSIVQRSIHRDGETKAAIRRVR